MPIGAPAPPPARGSKGSTKPPAGSKTLGSSAITQAREEGLAGLGQIATAVCVMTQNYADAGAFDMHFPGVAHEVAVLAEDNEKVANIVDRIVQVGPYAALLTATMPLVIQLLINHDRIKAEAAGLLGGKVMSKEALTAKVTADIERTRAQYMREAEEAKAEAARLREAA
jgi:hypothetical protein